MTVVSLAASAIGRIGIVALTGLAAKNAILIAEVAKLRREKDSCVVSGRRQHYPASFRAFLPHAVLFTPASTLTQKPFRRER